MAVILAPKITYSGDTDAARALRHVALQKLSNLQKASSFNNFPTGMQRMDLADGSYVVVGHNYGSSFAHVHIEPDSAYSKQVIQQQLSADFYVVSVEAVPVTLDASFGGGTEYSKWKVTWFGGRPPYTFQVISDPYGTAVSPVITNTDETIITGITTPTEGYVTRTVETDPWGAVDAASTTTNIRVGIVVTDSLGRKLFAAFSGNGGSNERGVLINGKFYTFGNFDVYGPDATDSFPLVVDSLNAQSITWTGGLSAFAASFSGVTNSSGNINFVFLDSNSSKRNVALNKMSGAYWAAVAADGTTAGVSIKITDSKNSILDIPLSSLTGDVPAYTPITLISALNESGIPTIRFKFGVYQYSIVQTQYFFSNTFNVRADYAVNTDATGNCDGFALQLQKGNTANDWCRMSDTDGFIISDGVGNSITVLMTSSFGPPAYIPINVYYNQVISADNNIVVSWTGGIGTYRVTVYMSDSTWYLAADNTTYKSVTVTNNNGSAYVQTIIIRDSASRSVELDYTGEVMNWQAPNQDCCVFKLTQVNSSGTLENYYGLGVTQYPIDSSQRYLGNFVNLYYAPADNAGLNTLVPQSITMPDGRTIKYTALYMGINTGGYCSYYTTVHQGGATLTQLNNALGTDYNSGQFPAAPYLSALVGNSGSKVLLFYSLSS